MSESDLTIERAIELAQQIAKSNSVYARDNVDLAKFLTEVLEMRKELAEIRKIGKYLVKQDIEKFGMKYVIENIPKEVFFEFAGSNK